LADLAIDVHDLQKTYRTPFTRKKVEALRGVTFGVERGHIFGFVGPNGAGKTTTIRMLMGLIRPTAGSARLLGHEIGSREARFQIGFLPESPYFYASVARAARASRSSARGCCSAPVWPRR
jgi:ABC-2 type transport system ATP-binding protein